MGSLWRNSDSISGGISEASFIGKIFLTSIVPLGFAKCLTGDLSRIPSGISRFIVGAVHQNRRGGIDGKKDNTGYLHPFLILIPPIFFCLVSNFAMAMGRWKLRGGNCRRDTCYDVVGLYVGFLASVWSWIILADRIF